MLKIMGNERQSHQPGSAIHSKHPSGEMENHKSQSTEPFGKHHATEYHHKYYRSLRFTLSKSLSLSHTHTHAHTHTRTHAHRRKTREKRGEKEKSRGEKRKEQGITGEQRKKLLFSV